MKVREMNERADKAFSDVTCVKDKKPSIFAEYRSLVRSFPSMILTNGYGPAMAFLFSKKNSTNCYGELYKNITDWLQGCGLINEKEINKNCLDKEMQYIIKQDRHMYRLLRNETLALLEWLKRFSEGMDECGKQ